MELAIIIVVCVVLICAVFAIHRHRRLKHQIRLACRHRRSSNSDSVSAGNDEVVRYRRMIRNERILLVLIALILLGVLAFFCGRALL